MQQIDIPQLNLEILRKGMPGITESEGGKMAESAAICLEDQKHQNGAIINIEGTHNARFGLSWNNVTEQMRRCHNDPDVATEYGACGIACLLIQNLTEYTITEKSWKGTGFDYWLGQKDGIFDNASIFQGSARLEVSGIRNGTMSDVKNRVNRKLKQTDKSDSSGLEAFIVVTEFSKPLSYMVKK